MSSLLLQAPQRGAQHQYNPALYFTFSVNQSQVLDRAHLPQNESNNKYSEGGLQGL